MKCITCFVCVLVSLFALGGTSFAAPSASPAPPAEPVKLIFMHHSTGGNWLADPNSDQPSGGLGRALMENNYYVSATNYGWGPDGIGDRTDIPNWPEWFLGPERDRIMQAVYTENGQNVGDFGAWSRMRTDPGGENTIVMFKSCFPNSDLYGNSNDPPLDQYNDGEYSVANAKAVYNALLGYFQMRPDKLFIIVTAPPLMRSDTTSARAANARAFNTWLVNEWLRDYSYANVAVFDYYNVLTHADNHHRWNDSAIEHIRAADANFTAYPSGDSHPSTAGHSKATAEFVPLLNVAYNRWRAAGPVAPPTAAPPVQTPETVGGDTPPIIGAAGVVDDFEAELAWWGDGGEGAAFDCGLAGGAHDGATALRLTYNIPAGSWVGCGRYYDAPQNWRDADGLALWQRTDAPGVWITFMAFSGDPEAATPFEFGFPATADWESVVISWDQFVRASWAEDGGLTALDPARITGISFSVGDGRGNVWLDDVALFIGAAAPPVILPAPEEPPAPGSGLCASAPFATMLLAVGLVMQRRRGQKRDSTYR